MNTHHQLIVILARPPHKSSVCDVDLTLSCTMLKYQRLMFRMILTLWSNEKLFKDPLQVQFRPLWVLHTAEEGRTNKKEPQSKAALVREVIMNVLAIDEWRKITRNPVHSLVLVAPLCSRLGILPWQNWPPSAPLCVFPENYSRDKKIDC